MPEDKLSGTGCTAAMLMLLLLSEPMLRLLLDLSKGLGVAGIE